MARRLGEIAGWTIGALLLLYVLFGVLYSLLVPECVIGSDDRNGRLYLVVSGLLVVATSAVVVVAALALRRRLPDAQRIVPAIAFPFVLVVAFLVQSPVSSVLQDAFDVSESTKSCF